MTSLRLTSILLAASALTGCTSVPVVWPLSAVPGAVPGYPSAVPSALPAGTKNCNDDGTTVIRMADGHFSPPDALYCAQNYALKTAAKFFSEERVVEATQNGENLALGGLGTAAGIEGVVTRAAIPVRNLGLAAAGLTGLDSVLGLKGQRTGYQAAAVSVECLIRLDAALDAAKTVADGSKPAGSADALTSGTTIMHALLGAVPARSAKSAQASGSDVLSAMGAEGGLRAVIEAEDASTAENALVAATQQNTDQMTRARNLQNGVQQVVVSLASALKSNDLTQVYAQAKQSFADLAGPVATAQKNAATAAAKVDKPGLARAISAVSMIAGTTAGTKLQATPQPLAAAAGTSMSASVDKAASDANVAQQVSTVYDACVGQAVTKPDPNTPSQGTGTPSTGFSSPLKK